VKVIRLDVNKDQTFNDIVLVVLLHLSFAKDFRYKLLHTALELAIVFNLSINQNVVKLFHVFVCQSVHQTEAVEYQETVFANYSVRFSLNSVASVFGNPVRLLGIELAVFVLIQNVENCKPRSCTASYENY
jgi:hypothetical protein